VGILALEKVKPPWIQMPQMLMARRNCSTVLQSLTCYVKHLQDCPVC